MKQLVTITALFFAFAFTAYTTKAQSVYHATKSYEGSWNSYSQKYVWGSGNSVDIRFTIQGDIVLVNDRAGSTYTTATQLTNDQVDADGGHEYSWRARDEKGIPCIFKLINYNDGSKLMEVFYSDYAFMYVIAG